MKLKTITSIISVFLVSSLIFGAETKSIHEELAHLLKEHRKYVNSFFDEKSFGNFDKAFFSDIGFIEQNETKSFLQNIENLIADKNTKSVVSVSYTSFTSINGVFKAVSYNYRNNGKDVMISKETNNNGKVLKAVYNYDTKGKLLSVNEYKDRNIVGSKKHSIKI